MVERVVRGSDRFCNYSFETLKIQGSNYRVPVLSGAVGKVIEKQNKVAAEDNSNRTGAAKKNKKGGEQRDMGIDYTHFISVPVKDPIIRQNYENLQSSIMSKKLGIQASQFTDAPTLHLTMLMLDLKDPVRFEAAKTVLQSLDREIMNLLGGTEGQDPRPIELTFKGLKTMQDKNPKKSKVLYLDIVKDENYELLQRIADIIITKYIEKGVTTERELSHVRYNHQKQLYEQTFHITVLRSARNQTMDATPIISEFSEAFFGKFTVQELHISSRSEFEAPDGQRMARKLFNQIRDNEATFACESSLRINFDDF